MLRRRTGYELTMSIQEKETQSERKASVFYDGACPLCDREIGFYRARRGADTLNWIDVNRCQQDEVAPGLSKKDALARFHVMTADGRLVAGGAAFSHLWASLPGFRLLGRIFSLRPLALLLDWVYAFFLKFRPCLQAGFRCVGGR